MRIGVATGTRADWGLLQPLATSLREAGEDVRIFATHQHLIPEMGNTISEIRLDGFEPVALLLASGNPAEIMAEAASGFAGELPRHNLDALILLGDRCEMLGVASAAMLIGIPIVHIAGGTVSEGAFDDSIRHAITKMATLHFPETEKCAERIRRMGENPQTVIIAGALGVTNALRADKMTREELSASLDGWNPGQEFLVVTLHAATRDGEDPVAIQQNMLDALSLLPASMKFLITYPNSDIDPRPLIEGLHFFENSMPDRVKVVPSLGHKRYLSAVALSKGVVGNSSSALVEVPSLGVPSLDIGIRQQGREHGPSVIHSDTTSDHIYRALLKLTGPEMQDLGARCINPYFQSDTLGIMTDNIRHFDFHPYPVKVFH